MANPLLTKHEQLEVLVTSLKGNDVKNASTVGKLLSPMIKDASHLYERLHQLKVRACVNIIFKFDTSREETNGDAKEVGVDKEKTKGDAKELVGDKDVGTECEYEISVLCEHGHPYLDDKVYEATRQGRIFDSTFLKGKN